MFDFSGKVAVISGATRGIGRSIALAFAESGANIAFINRNATDAEALIAELQSKNAESVYVSGSIDDPEKCTELVQKTMDTFGAVDFLVNNAGLTRDNLLLRMKPEEWQQVIDVNLSGVFHLTKACAKPMMKARSGRIVTISSVVGVMGNAGQSNYCASKAGVIGMTKSLAKELAPRNILCNVIAPGFIETDMTEALSDAQKEGIFASIPLKRMGKSEDIAHAALFLCSPLSSYITGETLHINGGMY